MAATATMNPTTAGQVGLSITVRTITMALIIMTRVAVLGFESLGPLHFCMHKISLARDLFCLTEKVDGPMKVTMTRTTDLNTMARTARITMVLKRTILTTGRLATIPTTTPWTTLQRLGSTTVTMVLKRTILTTGRLATIPTTTPWTTLQRLGSTTMTPSMAVVLVRMTPSEALTAGASACFSN